MVASLLLKVRQQIKDQAQALYDANLRQVKSVADGIESDAESYGVSNVIPSAYKKLFEGVTPDAAAY